MEDQFLRFIFDLKARGKSYSQIAAITGYSRGAIAGYFNRHRKDMPDPAKINNVGKSNISAELAKRGLTISAVARAHGGVGHGTVRNMLSVWSEPK